MNVKVNITDKPSKPKTVNLNFVLHNEGIYKPISEGRKHTRVITLKRSRNNTATLYCAEYFLQPLEIEAWAGEEFKIMDDESLELNIVKI